MATPDKKSIKDALAGIGMFAKITSVVATLIIGFLMLKFLPNYTTEASDILTKKFMPSLGIGFLGLVVTPVLVFVLFLTILGIPLAFLLGALFIIYLYFVRIYAMLAIGQKLSEWLKFKINSYWIFTIGVIIYYALTFLPILGGLVKLIILIASFGAALMNDKATWQKASKAKVV